MKSKHYTYKYFEELSKGSLQSAKEIIPLILNYISPKSVIDVGCGTGTWLSVWQQHGVNDILGIDGNYIDKTHLMINVDQFLGADLETDIPINRRFDLVMSLEVAEHIRPEFASGFIRTLCSAGDVILFSAAIPNQGGVLHCNIPGTGLKNSAISDSFPMIF
jgi:2-polyprenyl-3-methyl-5-hydroxy-6-metoxy-1,4-benzoquinol methylase